MQTLKCPFSKDRMPQNLHMGFSLSRLLYHLSLVICSSFHSPPSHSSGPEPTFLGSQTDPVTQLGVSGENPGQPFLCHWFAEDPQASFLIPTNLSFLV